MLVVVLAACSEDAPPAQPSGTSTPSTSDAADEYLDLHASMDRAGLISIVRQTDAPVATLASSIDGVQEIRDRLMWATHVSECTIDTTDMDRMGRARDLARLLYAHARVALSRGENEAASEDLAAITRMARHLGAGDSLDKLTGSAILVLGMSLATENNGVWNDQQREIILTALRTIDAADPLSLAAENDPRMGQSSRRLASEIAAAIQTLESR